MRVPICPRRLRPHVLFLAGLAVPALGGPPAARAADYGAVTNGNWGSPFTWTLSATPGANDNAFIGSTHPGGAAATATVTLTQDQQASTVVLGYGAGTSGTLDLGNFKLTAQSLFLGSGGGTGAITRGTGSVDVTLLELSASSLVMNGSDKTQYLRLLDGSAVTTAAVGNVALDVDVLSGSTLTLGADLDLSVSGSVDVAGDNSTLDARGHKITAGNLRLGWDGGTNVRLLNRGGLSVANLYVANQDFDLTTADEVAFFYLKNGATTLDPTTAVTILELSEGATATTAGAGNVTGYARVYSGSTLTLGADLNVEGAVDIRGDNSTLDAAGHKITASELVVGWFGGANLRLLNRGSLAVPFLYVANQDFDLTAADAVTNFYLKGGNTTFAPDVAVQYLQLSEGATASTSAVGNITKSVEVYPGSTLTLGAALNADANVYGTLDARGHKITAAYVTVQGGQIVNKGDLAITNRLSVSGSTLDLTGADTAPKLELTNGRTTFGPAAAVQSLYLNDGSAATTAAVGNVTTLASVRSGSTLTLGADLSVTGTVEVYGDNSTIDARNHKITADTFSLGLVGGANVRLVNRGDLAVTTLSVSNQNFDLTATDRVTIFALSNGSTTFVPAASVQELHVRNGSAAVTTAVGNITGQAVVSQVTTQDVGSTLILGADLSVSDFVQVDGKNSTLNAQGHKITADRLSLGLYSQNHNVRLLNDGAIAVGVWQQGDGARVELHDGNDTVETLSLFENSNLTVKSAATGLTIAGNSTGSLSISDTSTLTLELNGLQQGWVLRWADPAGGNHIDDLNALISQGRIAFSVSNGGEYLIGSRDGYTYVVQPVPEPALVLLTAAPVVGIYLRRCRKRAAAPATAA